MAAAKG
ncbi:hypothetical protein YPPY60_0946, partial [Yersinia pestis PY-60]